MPTPRRKDRILVYILMILLLLAAVAVQFVSYRKNRISVPKNSDSLVMQDPGYTHGRVRINIASAEMLAALPGIGDVLSQRIIDYRETHGPFSHASQLLQVEGITQPVLEKFQSHIDLSVPAATPAPDANALFDSLLSPTAPPTLADASAALAARLASEPEDGNTSFFSQLDIESPAKDDSQSIFRYLKSAFQP